MLNSKGLAAVTVAEFTEKEGVTTGFAMSGSEPEQLAISPAASSTHAERFDIAWNDTISPA
jgi:hypothetical protein